MKDFSSGPQKPIPFTIDGEEHGTFLAAPAGQVPGGLLLDLAAAAKEKDRATEAVTRFIELILLPESRPAFQARWSGEKTPTISIQMVGQIVVWLMKEHYAEERPTVPPSPSGNGRRTTGRNSTAGALPATSTPEPSLSGGS